MIESKYFKPRSVTWWASIAPLLGGLFLAFEPVHGLSSMADVIRNMAGGASAAVMINAGIAGIGLRGALK